MGCFLRPCSDLATPFRRTDTHPAALHTSRHALSPLEAVDVAIQRQMLLLRRDATVLRSNLIMVSTWVAGCGRCCGSVCCRHYVRHVHQPWSMPATISAVCATLQP
jgi:hypothetical protein